MKSTRVSLRNLVFVLFWILTAAILWLTLEPTPGGGRAHELPRLLSNPLNAHDALSNFLAFFVFSTIAFWLGHNPAKITNASPQRILQRQRKRFFLLLAFVASLEFAQIWIPGRISDLGDVASGWMGVVLAWLSYHFFFRVPVAVTRPKSLRILVWGINYSPELTGIGPYNTELCDYLFERGHRVRMLTTFPYYPAWRKLPTERFCIYRTDVLDGPPVHRCWHYVPHKVTLLTRLLHEASFVFTSMLRFPFLPCSDVIVVVSPPLLLGAAAALVCRFTRAKFVFHVQDLQPDAAAGLGMVKNQFAIKCLYRLEAFSYNQANRVSGISQGMLSAFTKKNVPREKQIMFPNGVHILDEKYWPKRGSFRKGKGIREDDFLVVYSGNMGVKQGLEILVEAARLLQNPRIRILFCGEGNQREAIEKLVQKYNLPNVTMIPLQPVAQHRELLNDADVCVITQQAGAGGSFFPSKLLMTLAFAKPVLTVADDTSDLARASHIAKFGMNVCPGQPLALALAIETMADSPERLAEFGKAGRAFVEQYRFSTVLGAFENELRSLTN
ncbi:MAG: colanic acid biosynthesis glycosyltransferase WcaI [Verrucomicrobiales bacterium]|nr:colanic acid biosynthesis glycosyltransferase WcaI [Verrucomicrobiales bacterium]